MKEEARASAANAPRAVTERKAVSSMQENLAHRIEAILTQAQADASEAAKSCKRMLAVLEARRERGITKVEARHG